MASRITKIRVLNHGTRFKAYYGLYIDCFLYYIFEASRCAILLFYFDFGKKFKDFSQITSYD